MSNSIKLSPLFTDGVVLQRDQVIKIWGHANPGDSVHVKVAHQVGNALTDDHGKFELTLPQHAAGGPFTMLVNNGNSEVRVNNVYFGDVWLLAGQSNMQMPISQLTDQYPDEVQEAHDQQIHYFAVPDNTQFDGPADELIDGSWQAAVGENITTMSGVGYFFAQQMRKQANVPIGLIQTAVAGTSLRCWLSEHDLAQLKELPADFNALKDEKRIKRFLGESFQYQQQYNNDRDQIDVGLKEDWAHKEIDDSWRRVDISQPIAKELLTSGAVWFKGLVDVPAELVGKPGMIHLGTLLDGDQTFVNGQAVGKTDNQYLRRDYTISKLSAKLAITIRLKIDQKVGGFRQGKRHVINVGNNVIDLDESKWFMKRGCAMPSRKKWFLPYYLPTGLYNGKIYPLRNLTFKGVLWYQGESDSHNPINYGKVFIHLIQSWRDLFNQPDLPFLFVQLPNCGIEPNHDWAAVRGQQAQAMALHHTAMVVGLGFGEDNDLHPLNKKAIAQQLAKLTRRMRQYPDGCASGPVALRAANDNGQIVIDFQTYGHQLTAAAGNAFVLETNGEQFLLNDYQVRADTIVINLPRQARITSDHIFHMLGLIRLPFLWRTWTGTPLRHLSWQFVLGIMFQVCLRTSFRICKLQ